MNHSILLSFSHAAALAMLPVQFWPYFTGIAAAVAGLVTIFRNDLRRAQGLDRAIVFGPLFLAFPMATFAGDHFIAPREIAGMISAWIPWHLFWAYFVGIALLAAAFSIVLRIYSTLAATLLGIMLLSFVLLMHLPEYIRNPSDRIALAIVLRDSSFSAGAFAFAIAQSRRPWVRSRLPITAVRLVIAIAAVGFGVGNILHPECVPVIPLEGRMPAWIPGHGPIAYLSGAVLIVCGLCLMVNWRARAVAAWLGIFVFAVVMLVYLPILLANFADIAVGLNYFTDTLVFSGVALLLAGALPQQRKPAMMSDTESSREAHVLDAASGF
jgi:uncharacterized membrane protein